MEYESAGEFTVYAKIQRAAKRSSYWYVAYCVIGVIVTIYVASQGFGLRGVPAFILAVSNAWGLLMVIGLMGYGLVKVPQFLWKCGQPDTLLDEMYLQTSSLREALVGSHFELEDVMTEVNEALASPILQDGSFQKESNVLRDCLEDVLADDAISYRPGVSGVGTAHGGRLFV